MLADLRGRLADGYLTKTDIATMASAVELRPPFLDHRLIELSQYMPSEYKIKNGSGKYIWKEIVKDKIPAEIINRRKMGFSIPLDKIIKCELKEMVEENIISDDCRIAERFNMATIKKMWQDHLRGEADYSNHIWSLLVLELWLRKYDIK